MYRVFFVCVMMLVLGGCGQTHVALTGNPLTGTVGVDLTIEGDKHIYADLPELPQPLGGFFFTPRS